MTLVPVLTPHGALVLRQSEDATTLELERAAQLEKAFVRGDGHGLLSLGADEPEPPCLRSGPTGAISARGT